MFVTDLQPSDLYMRWDAKTGPIGKILTITFPLPYTRPVPNPVRVWM